MDDAGVGSGGAVGPPNLSLKARLAAASAADVPAPSVVALLRQLGVREERRGSAPSTAPTAGTPARTLLPAPRPCVRRAEHPARRRRVLEALRVEAIRRKVRAVALADHLGQVGDLARRSATAAASRGPRRLLLVPILHEHGRAVGHRVRKSVSPSGVPIRLLVNCALSASPLPSANAASIAACAARARRPRRRPPRRRAYQTAGSWRSR